MLQKMGVKIQFLLKNFRMGRKPSESNTPLFFGLITLSNLGILLNITKEMFFNGVRDVLF
jgi:hypothetical protein